MEEDERGGEGSVEGRQELRGRGLGMGMGPQCLWQVYAFGVESRTQIRAHGDQ